MPKFLNNDDFGKKIDPNSDISQIDSLDVSRFTTDINSMENSEY